MAKTYERIYKVEGENGMNQIRVSVSYYKDGYGISGPRGYYMHVHAVTATDMGNGFISVLYNNIMGGYTYLLNEVKRASQKKFNEAIAMVDELLDEPLQTVISENDLTLVTNDYTEQFR